MELELGLGLPNHSSIMTQGLDLNYNSNRLATENLGVGTTTLSLLLRSGVRCRPEEDDGATRPLKWLKIHVDDTEIEGWPATNSSWKEPPRRRLGGSVAAVQLRKSMHVKVKMEGVAIGRKIDLRRFDSYQALTNTLIDMFAKYSKIDTNMEEYTLSYQDKEGDWMLVGDVQWEVFVESVQRVEIIRNDNRMGFQLLSRKS